MESAERLTGHHFFDGNICYAFIVLVTMVTAISGCTEVLLLYGNFPHKLVCVRSTLYGMCFTSNFQGGKKNLESKYSLSLGVSAERARDVILIECIVSHFCNVLALIP